MSTKRKSNEAQPPSPPSFQFVNANPQSDIEKASLKKLIRTNATNKYWRQRKKASTLARLPNQATQLISQIRKSDEPNSYEDLTDSGPRIPGTRKWNTHATVNELLQARPITSMSSIGIGQVDPFGTYPSDLPVHIINPVLAQVSQSLLQMFPPENGMLQGSVADVLYQKCLSERSLFHAFLFGQLARNQLQRSNRRKDNCHEMTLCHLETIKGINRRIQYDSTSCDDDNLLAVLALAVSGTPATNMNSSRSPSQGPLKALQALDVYGGALEAVPVHSAGLMKMISLRGGLHDMELPGLAQQLSYSDIIRASRDLTRPLLKFASINPNIELRLSAVDQQHLQSRMGNGFTVLKWLLPRKRTLHFYPVLRKLCSYTHAVHDYVEGRSEAQSLGILGDERNYVQHCLMSLNVNEESGETEQDYTVFNLCRLGAVIYSLLIVFPLQPAAAPFTKLGTEMKEKMSSTAMDKVWSLAPELMLWMTVMGSISSLGSSHRQWYVSMLVQHTQRLQINSWTKMKECLQEFLWFGNTSDVDGTDLWKEIQQTNPPRVR